MSEGTLLSEAAQFWGKARPYEGGQASHPVVAHCLDVAAVAVLLSASGGARLPSRTLGFMVALHDIGKFSRNFQAMAPRHWPTRVLGPAPASSSLSGPRHDSLGLYLLQNGLAPLLDPVLPPRIAGRRAWNDAQRGSLLRPLAGHHGRPPEVLIQAPGAQVVCGACGSAATVFIEAMLRVFDPPALPALSDRQAAQLGWWLAGVTTLADWVGSRQDWFPYVKAETVADPAGYLWDHALPRAAEALAATGLTEARPRPFTGMGGLFPAITHASPVQEWAEIVPLPDGPILAVVEDLTGSGKTEAALTLAHRLLAAKRCHGLFFALPTMATANAMFGRLAHAYRLLFAADATPSLALAHGKGDLDPRFRASISGGADNSRERRSDPADEPAESHCAAWLAEDRRRALMAQVGVGTLDQALLAVLPVRHAALRLQGLAGKVLIIDEVHAFDPYMRREILTLLEFHAALGGSVILLSATLPQSIRRDLVWAFRKGLGVARGDVAANAYPLATLVSASSVEETPCAPREGLPRRVTVTRLADAEAAQERLVRAARGGAAVAWVRNTVDDAIAAAAALRMQGLDVLLFHARYAMNDRLAVEQEVLRCFGRSSQGTERRRVLVATQVVEQSLDIDFDIMCSDLAPVDLLIQRAGRLWRHAKRERPVPGPELLVISPEAVDDPAADWVKAALPGTAAVYNDPALLWRGARAIFARGAIVTPDDMRPLIEAAFDNEAEGAVPPALAKAAGQAEGRTQAHTGIARQNLLEFGKCYDRSAGFWEPETHTPTRLEDRPQVTLRLALLREGVVVPYANDSDLRRAWSLSEVSVAKFRIAACPIPTGLEAVAAASLAGWGRWERESGRVLLAVMMPGESGYTFEAETESGQRVVVEYDRGAGLRWGSLAVAG